MFKTPAFIVLSRCLGQKSVCISLGSAFPIEKLLGGGTVKIASAPGPYHLILNWNRLELLKIDLEWTRNGPRLDLDLSLTILYIDTYKMSK